MKAEKLFDSRLRRKSKVLLLEITIGSPYISSNLENVARRAGKHFTGVFKRNNNE